MGFIDGEGNKHSPAMALDHEAWHDNHAMAEYKKYFIDKYTDTTDGSGNVVEQKAIAASNTTSTNLNNGDGSYGRRKRHEGKGNFRTTSAISIIDTLLLQLINSYRNQASQYNTGMRCPVFC